MDRRVKPRDDEEADPLLRRQRHTDLRLDRSLLLGVAPALWTEALELGEREEAQVAEDTRRLQLHAEIDSAQPAALLRIRHDRAREPRRQHLAQFLDAGLQKFRDDVRLI